MHETPEPLVALRRELHRHAEPGWCEVNTAVTIVKTLKSLHFDVRFGRDVVRSGARMGLPSPEIMQRFYDYAIRHGAEHEIAARVRDGFTGVVGIIHGDKPGPVVAVRMDMDANFGHEADDPDHLPASKGFRSHHAGVHHNCGHDGHTAIGIGLAQFLSQHRTDLCGEVRLIFQPAEEGLRGAKAMVEAGVLDGVDLFFGFHIGVQALEPGELIAGYRNILGSVKFDATFTGKSAHAAISPHIGRNAILAAAIATQALLSLPRHGDGETRINVGRISGGDSRNTIPSSARVEVEVRADSTPILNFLQTQAEGAVRGAALTQGVDATIDFCGRSCTGNSDPELTEFVARIAGTTDVVTSIRATADFKGSDDAAVMMDAVQRNGGQAVYMGFGSSLTAVHHNQRFDFDERVLSFGVTVLQKLVRATGDFSPGKRDQPRNVR
jgi:aminobenzoyl-glutamate utilization protein A